MLTKYVIFSGVPHTHHSPDVSIEDHMYGMLAVAINWHVLCSIYILLKKLVSY